MATRQERFRREKAYNAFRNAASKSSEYADAVENAFKKHQRFSDSINKLLTDSSLNENDYVTNGGKSPTIKEYKDGLKAICSFLVHANRLTKTKAKNVMSSAGISDTSIVPTKNLELKFDKIQL